MAPLISLRDTYDHVSVQRALAAVYQLTGDAQVRVEINELTMVFANRSAFAAWRFQMTAAIDAAKAEIPDAFDQGHDREVRRDPSRGVPDKGPVICIFIPLQSLKQAYQSAWRIFWRRLVEGHPGLRRTRAPRQEGVAVDGFERITGCPTGQHRSEFLALHAVLSRFCKRMLD